VGDSRNTGIPPGNAGLSVILIRSSWTCVTGPAVLEAKLAELLGASSRIEDLQIENLADPLDHIKSALDREMAMNELEVQARLVQDVRAALEQLMAARTMVAWMSTSSSTTRESMAVSGGSLFFAFL
jgi:hypothetical protein